MSRQTHWYRRLILVILSGFLAACSGGAAKFQPSTVQTGYDKKLDSLNVVIEVSHLKRAFAEYQIANPRNPVNVDAVLNNTKNTLLDAFKSKGIISKVFYIDSDKDKSELFKFASLNREIPLMHVAVSSFKTATKTNSFSTKSLGWTGELTWRLSIYDFAVVAADTNSVKPIWSANTEFMNYGPWRCSNENYVECAKRFSVSILDQLKSDGFTR